MSETVQDIAPVQVSLTVNDGAAAIDFYQRAFGAEALMREAADDGVRLKQATLALFGGRLMLADEFPESEAGVSAPLTLGGTGVTVHVNMDGRATLDAAFARAAAAGARVTMAPADQPWGAYYGRLKDPFGHSWSFAAEGT